MNAVLLDAGVIVAALDEANVGAGGFKSLVFSCAVAAIHHILRKWQGPPGYGAPPRRDSEADSDFKVYR